MNKQLKTILLFIMIISMSFNGCKKPDLTKEKEDLLKTMNGNISLNMNIQDIYAALPQTVFYNIAKDGFTLYTGRAQWKKGNGFVQVRIPTTTGNNAYIYAVKTVDDPGKIKVFAVQYRPAAGSNPYSFTGTQMWIDFQNWHVYGVQFAQGQAIAHLTPQKLADPDWETCGFNQGKFGINAAGKIYIKGEAAGRANRPTGDGDLGCFDFNGNFWDKLGDFFDDIIGGIEDIIGGIGGWLEDLFPPGGGGSGGGWNPGAPSGPGGPGPGPGPGPGGSSGGGYTPPADPDPGPYYPPFWIEPYLEVTPVLWADLGSGPVTGDPSSNPTTPVMDDGILVVAPGGSYIIGDEIAMGLRSLLGLSASEYAWLVDHPLRKIEIRDYLLADIADLTYEEEKAIAKEHLQLLISSPEYYDYIHDQATGNWWDKDEHGFTYSKKKQLDIYVKLKPFGLLDCTDLALDEWTAWQEIGSYAIPSVVGTRISTIISDFSPDYSLENFYIQKLTDAKGPVVNCDVFRAHITELPENELGITMTPEEFLDYFRININQFDVMGDNVGTTFGDYLDTDLSPTFSDFAKRTSSYEASIGALATFHNPAPVFPAPSDDGTVIQTAFDRSSTHKWFMFTTMHTPVDGDHPVAGNRRFGIFPDLVNGGYCFYTRGVDRTYSRFSTEAEGAFGIVFGGADALWNSVIKGAINLVQLNDGNASYYSGPAGMNKRVYWYGPVRDFLQGRITLAELRSQLNCLD